jgi:soluble lytic murein transglycosylase-like protein
MKRLWLSACVLLAMLPLASEASAQERARYEKVIAKHAKANLVPEALVHRLIVRESRYNPGLIGHGGTIGLMQIKLATAKGVGYTGDAEGLLDPETNLTYGVKYLAGAYRAAGGDYDRAIRYFAGGYYYAAKQQRLERLKQGKPDFSAAPPDIAKVEDKPAAPTEEAASADDLAASADTDKPEAAAKPAEAPVKLVHAAAKPAHAATKPKAAAKRKLADAKEGAVPRPPAVIPSGANGAKPR